MLPVMTRAPKPTPCLPRSVRAPSSRRRRVTASASGSRPAAPSACARSPSMCPTSRTVVSAVRLRTETGPSAGMDRTATPWVALTWAITGRRAVCSGRSVTHTARCQPRSRSILRPAAISSLRSVGGCTSRPETNSARHRTPGSCPASRSAISPTRLSVSSDAGPGAAGRPTTSSDCGLASGTPSAAGPSDMIPFTHHGGHPRQVGRPPTSPDRSAGRVVVRQSRSVPDDGVDGGTRAVGVQHDEHRRAQVGLPQPATSRTAVDDGLDPQARDSHGNRRSEFAPTA